MSHTTLIMLYLAIFASILMIISIYILIKLLKSEKEAYPYLRGLFLYFFIMGLVNILQTVVFLVLGDSIAYTAGIYNNYIVILLILIAPIPLIFQIEKLYFPNTKLLAKYHVFSMFLIVGFVGYVIWSLIELGIAPIINPLTHPGVEMGGLFENIDYGLLFMGSWALIVFFICGSFLYLGLKASGKFRKYSLIILVGWGINQIINAVGQTMDFNTLLQFNILTMIFIIKFLGAIITAIGFYKLYGLSQYA